MYRFLGKNLSENEKRGKEETRNVRLYFKTERLPCLKSNFIKKIKHSDSFISSTLISLDQIPAYWISSAISSSTGRRWKAENRNGCVHLLVHPWRTNQLPNSLCEFAF